MDLKDLLIEIGKSSGDTFPYTKEIEKVNPDFESFRVVYSFESEDNEYRVDFHGIGDGPHESWNGYKVNVNFSAEGYTHDQYTEEHNSLKVLNTIMKIVKDFHESNSYDIFYYFLTGASTPGEDLEKNSKRARVYKKLITRYFPDARIELEHGTDLYIYP